MPTKKTLEEFIKEAREKHGNKYDYSKVNYVNTTTKITIVCPDHGDFIQLPVYHIKTQGCQICSGAVMNTNIFIEKANKIHNNKYDYSKVNYVNNKTEVIIKCPEHNIFKQPPNSHLTGYGCGKCGKCFMNTNYFIEKAKKIHGDKYNYSKVNYVNNETNVVIICNVHDEFLQNVNNHLRGNGCPKCSRCFMDKNYFIEKANKIHNNKYDYSKVDYINTNTKVIILCSIHGNFLQSPDKHLQKRGCKKCQYDVLKKQLTKSNENFIKDAILIHGNKYDYSKVNYIGNKHEVTIVCSKHAEFKQRPNCHLNGRGCPKCNPVQYSNMAINYLNFMSKYYNIKIQHALNGGEFLIPETKYRADGYCKKNNTIFELHGNIWHGNPKIYKPEDMSYLGKTYGELYKKTIKKENKIKDLGYNLVVMWEHDWKKINKSIKLLQKKFKARKNK